MPRTVVDAERQEPCGGGTVRIEQDEAGTLFVHCDGHGLDEQPSTGTLMGAVGVMLAHLVTHGNRRRQREAPFR